MVSEREGVFPFFWHLDPCRPAVHPLALLFVVLKQIRSVKPDKHIMQKCFEFLFLVWSKSRALTRFTKQQCCLSPDSSSISGLSVAPLLFLCSTCARFPAKEVDCRVVVLFFEFVQLVHRSWKLDACVVYPIVGRIFARSLCVLSSWRGEQSSSQCLLQGFVVSVSHVYNSFLFCQLGRNRQISSSTQRLVAGNATFT